MDLGMSHVSEDTLADLMKPILGLVGIKGGRTPLWDLRLRGWFLCYPRWISSTRSTFGP